jgi:hypothetical protein
MAIGKRMKFFKLIVALIIWTIWIPLFPIGLLIFTFVKIGGFTGMTFKNFALNWLLPAKFRGPTL